MTASHRKMHFFCWAIIAAIMLVSVTAFLILRPPYFGDNWTTASDICIKRVDGRDGQTTLIISFQQFPDAASCLVYLVKNDGEIRQLGAIDRPGMHRFQVPAASSIKAVVLRDAIKHRDIISQELTNNQ